MKILELRIQGFRSLYDVAWKPGRLNIVIGPNGTGKSNLLRLLEMLSASAQGKLSRFVQGSGGLGQLVWDGRDQGIAAWMRTALPVSELLDLDSESLTYELVMLPRGQTGNYSIADELLQEEFGALGTAMREPSRLLGRNDRFVRTGGQSQQIDIAPMQDMPEEETLLSHATGLFTLNEEISSFRARLGAWSIYHDVRVDRNATIRSAPVARMDKLVEPDGQNLVNVLHTLYTSDREFKNDVNRAMRAAFGDEFEELVFPPAADQRVQLRIRWKSLKREQSAADLSDGTLRFLFLLAVLASPAAAPLIAIDEPETGLHPSMFPIIAEYAADAARRSQVILTTHSPAMLDAFKDTLPTTTVALWENGQTVLKTIEGGVLEEWVKNYSLGKLFTSGELEQLAAGTL